MLQGKSFIHSFVQSFRKEKKNIITTNHNQLQEIHNWKKLQYSFSMFNIVKIKLFPT